MTLDTSAYTAGDVLADTQTTGLSVSKTQTLDARIRTITVVDQDDQGAAFDIYFLTGNVSLGPENSPPNISDANALNIIARVPVLTTDYADLGGVRIAYIRALDIPFEVSSNTSSPTTLYVGIINGAGTPTYSATGIILRLGITTT